MTVTLELPPEIEARFVAEAQSKGLPVGEVLKSYLVKIAPPPEAARLSPEESDRAIDELFDSMSGSSGVQEGAFHRENWYR